MPQMKRNTVSNGHLTVRSPISSFLCLAPSKSKTTFFLKRLFRERERKRARVHVRGAEGDGDREPQAENHDDSGLYLTTVRS